MPRHSERWLFGLAASVVAALVSTHVLQWRAIPAQLRYLPVENEAFIVSAPLDELWHALEPHLASYFDASPLGEPIEGASAASAAAERTASPLLGTTRALQRHLAEAKIELRRPADLDVVGIDARRPAGAALVRSKGEVHWLAVLPVSDRTRLIQGLEKLLSARAEAVSGAPGVMRRVGDLALAFGHDGWALLSDDRSTLEQSLRRGDRNLDDWRSSDRVARAMTAPLPATAGAARAWLRGRWRASEPLPPGSEFYFALAIDTQTLALDGRTVLPLARSQFVADLLHDEAERAPSPLLPRTELGFGVGSVALPRMLRDLFAALDSAGVRPLGGRFAPVLDELRRGSAVRQLGVAVSDTRQRVPGVVMGLQMPAADAEAFVLRLRSALRIARDSEVLRSAGKQHRAPARDAAPDIAALLMSGEIRPERGALWERYRWHGETLVAEPPLSAQDFTGDDYVRTTAGGAVMHYLMPPFTANDLEHRFAAEREELQVDDLLADRYRLCSTYDGHTLWIGNDAAVLADWTARLAAEPPSRTFADATDGDARVPRAKAIGFAQPARLLEAAQLYADNDINRLARAEFADLAPFGSIVVGVSVDSNEHELHGWATLRRR